MTRHCHFIILLDYYEVKIAAPSTEISELGKLKLLQSLDNGVIE
jgi:hypothetical protein